MSARRAVLVFAGALCAGCAAPSGASRPEGLLGPGLPPAVAGEGGYGYQNVASADLDGDGAEERVFLVANAELRDGQPVWDDSQIWQLYVEEADGRRTYLYARPLQLGRAYAFLSHDASGGRPAVVLFEHTPHRLAAYEFRYRGPDDARSRTLTERLVDRHLE